MANRKLTHWHHGKFLVSQCHVNIRSSFGFFFLFILVFNFLTVYCVYTLYFYLIIPSLTLTLSYNPCTSADPLLFPATPLPIMFVFAAAGLVQVVTAAACSWLPWPCHIQKTAYERTLPHAPALITPQATLSQRALRLLHTHLCSCGFSPCYFGCIIWGITTSHSKIVTGLSVPSRGLSTGVSECSHKPILMYELEGCR